MSAVVGGSCAGGGVALGAVPVLPWCEEVVSWEYTYHHRVYLG